MAYYALKVLITSILVVAVSEVAKRSSLIGALLASLPVVSILGMIWLYLDERDPEKISSLSQSLFWLVLPSLPMFLILPQLLRRGVSFPWAMATAILITVGLYAAMVWALQKFGIST